MSKVNRNEPKRSKASESRYSLMEFERDFPNDRVCLEYLVKELYPNGMFCPTCNKVTKHYRDKKRPSYACEFCGHHEHPMAGTIFQDSATSLKLWFYAIYLMAATRCGISAKQLERELGVTYKTAWRMDFKIRALMAQDTRKLDGTVEIDETYIGPHRRGVHGRPMPGDPMVPVLGIAQRKTSDQPGKIIATVIPDATIGTLIPAVQARVLYRSTVYTDEYLPYKKLTRLGYRHSHIPHGQKVYVSGNVHTNTVEGFWALVKNGIRGVYHGVSTKHLQTYLDEYTFRFNHRKQPRGIFTEILSRVRKPPVVS